VVLRDVAPLTFRGVCLGAGGIGILLLARLARQPLTVPSRYWSRLVVLSVCTIMGWNVLVIYGVSLMPAGRAALLGYTMPLWSVALSVPLLGEALTARRVFALLVGMCGIAVLMGKDAAELGAALAGAALMVGAAFSWGLGMVLLKRFALPIPTAALTGWMMLVGGSPILAGAALIERDQWRPIGVLPALGLVYNVVVSFMFCYWAWNRLVLMVPVAISSISSLATPVLGVLSGMWLLGEPLTWREIVAGAGIMAAIALVLRAPGQKPMAAATETTR